MKKLLLVLATFALFTGCGGGNGDGSGKLDHNELASLFVKELNLDTNYDVTIAKDSTLQKNFIVIYDSDFGSYDAINIDGFTQGQDAAQYYADNSGRFFYDLDLIPGYWTTESYLDAFGDTLIRDIYVETQYRDRASDLYFEKTEASSKDLEKMAALKEAAKISKSAESISAQFGLSLERGQEVAKLALEWKKNGARGLSDADHDAFSEEILGFSITDAKKAALSGNQASIESLINKAAETNSVSPEQMGDLFSQFMNK